MKKSMVSNMKFSYCSLNRLVGMRKSSVDIVALKLGLSSSHLMNRYFSVLHGVTSGRIWNRRNILERFPESMYLQLVLLYMRIEPIWRKAWIILYISWSIYLVMKGMLYMMGGIGDALVPFLTGNNNPAPGLPPSSSGEPVALLIPTEREVETSSHFQEVPSVDQEEIWDAVDFEEQPLISDNERRDTLYHKMVIQNHDPEKRINKALLEVQLEFEKTVEKHLRRCGYSDRDIHRYLPDFRHFLLYAQGRKQKKDILNTWIREMEENFRRSKPYKIMLKKVIAFAAQERINQIRRWPF